MTRTAINLLAVLAFTGGCDQSQNVGTKTGFTCAVFNKTVNGQVVNECVEFHVSSSDTADARAACSLYDGQITFDPCPQAGALGTCSGATFGNSSATVYLFPDDRIQTTEGAQTACRNIGGMFTPAAQ